MNSSVSQFRVQENWVPYNDACAAALEVGATNYYRFVRRYLERNAQLSLSLRQVDPLIRQLTLYRDLIQNKTKEIPA